MAGTYAGQFVTQGFLNLHLSRSVRLVVTRLVTILPLTVLAGLDQNVVDSICRVVNISQAFLLPFALIPLLLFSFSSRIMGVFAITGWRKWGVCTLALGVTLGNYCISVYQLYSSLNSPPSLSSATSSSSLSSLSLGFQISLAFGLLLFCLYGFLLFSIARQEIRGIYCLYLLANQQHASSSSSAFAREQLLHQLRSPARPGGEEEDEEGSECVVPVAGGGVWENNNQKER